MTKKKKAKFNADGIDSLAKNKPVAYKIFDKNDVNVYTGKAKMGRVGVRLKEHLPGGPDPIQGGVRVEIIQKGSIAEAEKTEARIIKQAKPSQNKKGK
ncbi:hypothetical protein KAR91_32655 [Candidatus Pacearchaeota archaeon]|nr:hypothetical protein [Candidatus Pacearchaeota archaeon]